MKELEEVNCEIRRIVDLRLSISEDRTNVERDERESSDIPGECGYSEGLLGGFLNDANYAWLSRGSSLTVYDVKTGVGVGSWTFCWKVACVGQFPARPEEPPLLLVGLDNGANRIKDSLGLLCVFDFTTSRVLRAIRMPVGIEQVCVVSGGAEWEEPNDTPMEMDGIACVALRNLRHVMIDLRRGTWETSDGCTVSNEASPVEMEFLEGKEAIRSERSRKEKHAAYNLLNGRIERHIGFRRDEFESSCLSEERLTSTVTNLSKIGCLISGCLGRAIVWQRDGSVGWISSIVDENTVATHIAVLEPSDDPRPFYYLWIVFQEDSSSVRGKVGPLLRMYALLFERKYDEERGKEYLNLEADPCLKFEFELDARDRVVGLSTIERETSLDQNEAESRRAEESRLLIRSRERTLLFDLNQWYKEQMPRTIGECKNPNSVLASYGPIGKEGIISCSYVPRTLREYTSTGPDCQEELFYPNSLSLEWVELSGSRLTFRMCRGIQAELLREIAIGGPIVLIRPSETFHRSLSVGLLPFATEYSFASDQDAQREMLLSLCLEQRWSNFLVRCGNEWSDGSAAYLYPKFLKWGIERASAIKTVADRLCENLFDQSGNDIGEAEVRTLWFCSQQLECLSNVVGKLPLETADLTRERRALKRVSVYFQALLWFYDVGLLPESQNLEENPSYRSGLPISLEAKIPYPFAKLYEFYEDKRESRRRRRRWTRRKSLRGGLFGKGMPMKHAGDGPIGRGWEEEKEKAEAEAEAEQEQEEREEGLFIDELIARECPAVKSQWEREARDGGTAKSRGLYPPPSLQSLLRIYLTNCYRRSESREMEYKHQIAIYLLMDLAMLLQGSCSGVDQLIKYPSAFKMSPSLIKLTQAFWLLDHEDSQGFLDAMTGQLVSDSDVKDWHHRLVLGTLVRTGQQKLALTYLRVRKPPLSSIEDQSTMIQLSVEHGLVQSAFRRRPRSHYAPLLTSFFRACKSHGRLADILHLAFDPEEERILSKFLEDEATEDVRSLYYLQRSRYTEARRSGDSRSLEADVASMVSAYNATLPDVMKRFSVKMLKSNLDGDSDSRYPRPMSHRKSYSRSIGLQETAIRKAKETRALRGKAATDASRIPFITAPCATLKSLEDRSSNAATECVLFPRFTSNPRKRSFDRTRENSLADGEEENEENKRRKTEETASAAPFHTPLVRRKNDTPGGHTPFSEIPQSILKVRRLVGSSENSLGSESRTIAISSSTPEGRIGESGEHHRAHGHNRINRQIRFSIGRPNADEDANVCRTGEATGENAAARLPEPSRETVENREVPIVPHLTDVSMESPILMDTTCTASPGRDFPYSPRPRAGLGGMRPWTRNLGRSETIREDGSELFSTSTVLQETTVHSSLSYSGYSTAVLSPDSSFESKASPNWDRHKDNDRRLKPPFPASSTLPTADRPDARDNDDDDDNEDDNEDDNGSATTGDKIKADWKNGRVSKTPIANENDSSFLRRNESATKDERAIKDSRIDKVGPLASLSAGHPDTSGLSLRPKNGENSYDVGDAGTVDVTDDESSDGDGERIFPPREKSGQPPYDFFNITEDESESSVDEPPRPKARQGASRTSECSVVTEEAKETASGDTGEDPRERKPDPVEASVRITRSRGTTSMERDLGDSKGIPPSPRVYRPERTGSGRFTRASSLAKEVTLSSVLSNSPSTEENIRRMTSSPQKNRQRRAASLAKDDLAGQSKNLEIDVDSPLLRRSARRRSASVQKDLPEPTRSLTKRNGVEAAPPPSTLSEDGGAREDRDSVPDGPKPRVEKRSTRSKDEGKGKSSDKTVQRAEEGDGERFLRRRGSSVPKESQTEYKTRSRRSSSLAKEVEVASPAGNSKIRSKASTEGDLRQGSSTDKSVRTRRSSIQSIPEELEEILSVPFRERNLPEVPLEEKLSTSSTSSTSSASSRRQSSRRTRAASLDLLTFETKRTTRSARGRNVLGETIAEEESLQVENDETVVAALNDISAMKTRRATSETPVSEEKTPKPRRGRRTSLNRQTSTDRFSFSQPENPVDLPHDRKDVGQVPNYVFSPPHTRSKTAIPDRHCRRVESVVSILRDENIVEQEEEQQQKKKIMLKGL